MTKTLNLILLRHGITDHNTGLRLTGWGDPDLNPEGQAQAKAATSKLAQAHKIEAIYVSPLRRAQQTAQYLADVTGLPLIFDPDLKELNFGEMEGRTIPEMKELHPELFTAWRSAADPDFGWPGGETRLDFHTRVDQAIWRVIQDSVAHGYETVAIVGHGGALAGFASEILVGQPYVWREYLLENCEYYLVAADYEANSDTKIEKNQVGLRLVTMGKLLGWEPGT